MTENFYVYKMINIINNMYYIGCRCSGDVKPVEDVKYRGRGKLILEAYKEFPDDNMWEKIILKEFHNHEKALEYESELVTIDEIEDSKCYNMLKGGGGSGTYGLTHNAESVLKMVNTRTGKPLSSEHCKNISNGQKGTKRGHQNSEWRQAISKSLKGKKLSNNHRKAISKGMLGMIRSPHSDSARKNISNSLLGRKVSDETKKRMSKAQLSQSKSMCKWCGNKYGGGAMSQWHGDKCIKNPSSERYIES